MLKLQLVIFSKRSYIMFTKENTKIFIDTNIFLGLYNSNEAGNVKIFLHSLFKNKSILITTEQAINEYLRNGTRVINELKTSFLATSDHMHHLLLLHSKDIKSTKNVPKS